APRVGSVISGLCAPDGSLRRTSYLLTKGPPLNRRPETCRNVREHAKAAFCLPGSKLLPRGTEQDLVHIHILRLIHSVRDSSRERISRNCNLISFTHVLGDVRLGNGIGQLRGYDAG